jgi:hypothetical protein
MEESPSREANRFAASQEIPRILWNPDLLPHLQEPAPCPKDQPKPETSVNVS